MHKELHVENDIVAHRYRGKDPKYALVISHGIAGHGGVYNRFCVPHAKRGVDIWSYDAPGHGQSTPLQPRGQWTMQEWVDAATTYAEHVKAETGLPVFAMGSSLGGAAAYSSLTSDAIEGLILMGAPAIPGTPWIESMADAWRNPAVIRAMESLGRGARMDISLYFDFDKDYGYPGAGQNLRLDPYTTWNYDMTSWASLFQYDPVIPPQENTKPVLIASGEHDPVATPEMMQGVAKSLSGPVDLVCMEGASHQLMQFHTASFSDLVHDWVLKRI